MCGRVPGKVLVSGGLEVGEVWVVGSLVEGLTFVELVEFVGVLVVCVRFVLDVAEELLEEFSPLRDWDLWTSSLVWAATE